MEKNPMESGQIAIVIIHTDQLEKEINRIINKGFEYLDRHQIFRNHYTGGTVLTGNWSVTFKKV